MGKKLIAEFVGTFLLVFLAVGAAVFGIAGKVGANEQFPGPGSGVVGVALAFGLVLMGLAYAFGPVSGTHVNPAVTLAMWLGRKMPTNEAVGYVIAQFAGAILGGAVLRAFVAWFGVTDQTGSLGTNAYNNGSINLVGAFVLEVLLTAAFVGVILLVTERAAAPGFAGIAIGLTLTAVHLVGIPLDGTSVNPARSFGPALFDGWHALGQVWLFIVAPLVGSLLAVAVWRATRVEADEDSSLELEAGSERDQPPEFRQRPLRQTRRPRAGPNQAPFGSVDRSRRGLIASPGPLIERGPDQGGGTAPTHAPRGRNALATVRSMPHKSPKDFFRPLAVGAPEPLSEIPARPSRAIHFFDPGNDKMAAKVPGLVGGVDVLLGNLEDAIKADRKVAAREGLVEIALAPTSARPSCGPGSTRWTAPGSWTT